MEDIFLGGQESLEDKQPLSHSQKNNAHIEKDDHFTLSECELDCEHITSKLPLVLDINQQKRSRRCSQIHNSCPSINHLNLLNSVDFTSTSKSTTPFCIHSAEFNLEKSSLLSIPASMTPSSYKSRNFKQRGKARSAHSLTDYIVECSPVARSRNLVLSPSTRWVFDSIEATLKARALMKSSVIFPSVPADVDMKRIMSKPISIRDMISTELLSSHSRLLNTTSGNPKAMVIPCRRQRSELNISQEVPFSCSSSNLTSLYHSHSSAVVNSALLQCVWESGNPYFAFSVGEDHSNIVYTASAHKTKSSVDKALDYIYLLHAWKDKESKNNAHNASNIVGKMKVRCSLLLNSSRSKHVETEFVLAAANEDSSSEMQRVTPSLTKSKGLSSKLSEIFRRRHYSKSNSIQEVGESSSQIEDLPELYVSELGINDETGYPRHPFDDFPHNLELAAIVVQDFGYERKHGATPGGWGLKFLEKVETDDANSSQGPPSSSATCKETYMEHINSDRNVNVLIPAGFHGVPITRTGGPSSLTERWRSNGHCDCGGWDIGCPLTVLNNNSIYSKGLLLPASEEDCKPLDLFKEGAKHGEPTFKIFSVSKDMYVVCFQSTLSALQSFSIGVATIHSQTPDLYPKW